MRLGISYTGGNKEMSSILAFSYMSPIAVEGEGGGGGCGVSANEHTVKPK